MLQANVMLEYTLEDATNLLVKNIDTAKKNLGYVEHDLDFLRQVTAYCKVTSLQLSVCIHVKG